MSAAHRHCPGLRRCSHDNAGVPGNLPPPPKIWSPRAKFPRKFGPPFGNLAPLYKHGTILCACNAL